MIQVRVIDRSTWGTEGPYPNIVMINIAPTCPACGGPRGKPVGHWFHEDGEQYYCDRWENPCGHVDTYESALREAAGLSQPKPDHERAAELAYLACPGETKVTSMHVMAIGSFLHSRGHSGPSLIANIGCAYDKLTRPPLLAESLAGAASTNSPVRNEQGTNNKDRMPVPVRVADDPWTDGQRMLLWAADADWIVLEVAGTVLEHPDAGRVGCRYAVERWLPAQADGLWVWEGSARQPDKIVHLAGTIRRPTTSEVDKAQDRVNLQIRTALEGFIRHLAGTELGRRMILPHGCTHPTEKERRRLLEELRFARDAFLEEFDGELDHEEDEGGAEVPDA